jgi:hypothetical protein
MAMADTVNDAGNDNGVIRVLTKQGSGYDLSDLVGTWRLHSLWAGPRSPFWDRGSVTVASDGTFTFTIEQYDGGVESGGGQFQIASDGSVTVVGESDPWHMSADKSVMAMADTVNDAGNDNGVIRVLTKQGSTPDQRLPHDWNGDGIVSIVGDVPPFVDCVYFSNCPDWPEAQLLQVGDCNGDGILSIVGDMPCFVDCVYFGNCPE